MVEENRTIKSIEIRADFDFNHPSLTPVEGITDLPAEPDIDPQGGIGITIAAGFFVLAAISLTLAFNQEEKVPDNLLSYVPQVTTLQP